MKDVYVMMGASGSGKSTLAHFLHAQHKDSTIISSDEIRKMILGDESDQSFQSVIWREFYFQLREALMSSAYNEVYCDATNLKRKDRMKLLKYIEELDAEPSLIIMKTPIETCIENDKKRNRHVGEEVIKRQFEKAEMPGKDEKWAHIYEFGEDGWKLIV